VSEFDRTVDVLVAGSGAAGLVAALRADWHGLSTLLVEKSDKIGGTSAYSGGGLWVPNNAVTEADGLRDSFDEALTYLDDIIGDAGPASSHERRVAFLTEGPAMIAFLIDQGFRWRRATGYADYYPHRPGGKAEGRGIEPQLFDANRLGAWREHLRMSLMPPLPMYTNEASSFALMVKTRHGAATAARVVGRLIGQRLRGHRPLTNGHSLVAQLLALNLEHNLPIWRESPLLELITEDGVVVGAVVEHDGRPQRIRAMRGVVLTTGGFARNPEMRAQYGPAPSSVEWTSVPPDDHGDGIRAGLAVGADTALMDDAWWGPTLLDPATGHPSFILWERSFPHSIIVDAAGARFMNESESYVDAGHAQYERNATVKAIPAWMIVDTDHRRRYPMATLPPGLTPKSALESGYITKASTLEELAGRIGVDPAGLRETVTRFNTMAERGVDEDYGRGSNAYDNWYGDPSVTPNPNLGPIARAPFYALQVWPGDLGTKGGLLTDERARVLDGDGTPIGGLYAAGNASASVMGRTYAGPGATLGPAATFAFVAADDLAAIAPASPGRRRLLGADARG
jgi:succinate dehydrogenase/fumarate reductase flavoprotein subunit